MSLHGLVQGFKPILRLFLFSPPSSHCLCSGYSVTIMHSNNKIRYAIRCVLYQVWQLEAALEAQRAVCDRQERQLQLNANQLQRHHNADERYGEAQRRLRTAEVTIQNLQAEMQVGFLLYCCDCNVNSGSQIQTCLKAEVC